MAMEFTFPITVEIHHRVINETGDWSITSSYSLPKCAISISVGRTARRSFEYETFESDVSRADIVLYAPPGSDIRADDTVTLPDTTVWSVWGYAVDYASPFTNWRPGMAVRLRRYTG